MEYKDYYKILGIPRDADDAAIRQAYRKMAKKYHPDVSKETNAENRFKEVGEAYEVLKDSQKRAAYDQLGSNWQQGQDFRPPPGWNPGFDFEFDMNNGHRGGGRSASDFSDFFSSIFNGGFAGSAGQRTRHNPNQGAQNQQAKIKVDLEDALNGAKRTITLRGANGERSLTVNIPKGVKAGQRIRLSGQGQPGPNGKGDLLLEIEFHPHRLYQVDERDLTLEVPIAPWEAALGTTITIPVPGGGKAEIKIPQNSRSGRKLRLKGKGIPGKPAGDLYLRLQVELPSSNDSTAKRFYENMAKEIHFNPRAHLGL